MRQTEDAPGCISKAQWKLEGYNSPKKPFYCLACVRSLGIAFDPALGLKTWNPWRTLPTRVCRPLVFTALKLDDSIPCCIYDMLRADMVGNYVPHFEDEVST